MHQPEASPIATARAPPPPASPWMRKGGRTPSMVNMHNEMLLAEEGRSAAPMHTLSSPFTAMARATAAMELTSTYAERPLCVDDSSDSGADAFAESAAPDGRALRSVFTDGLTYPHPLPPPLVMSAPVSPYGPRPEEAAAFEGFLFGEGDDLDVWAGHL